MISMFILLFASISFLDSIGLNKKLLTFKV